MKVQNMISYLSILILLQAFAACAPNTNDKQNATEEKEQRMPVIDKRFGDYWYKGEAELTSFKLQQARYGEIHEGTAVHIFVTEDFSRTELTKLNDPNAPNLVKILKLNFTKKFVTGIYPYSMMLSAFTPVDVKNDPHTLRVSTTSQEWCGHTYMDASLKNGNYNVYIDSYFESEGRQEYEVEPVFMEDEIWNRIRIAPESLPTGEIELLPGSFYARLKHKDYKPWKATATLNTEPKNDSLQTYTVKYLNDERELSITFEKQFPHKIQSWTETYKSGFGENVQTLTTKATRMKTIMLDYWNRNGTGDRHYREELGLK